MEAYLEARLPSSFIVEDGPQFRILPLEKGDVRRGQRDLRILPSFSNPPLAPFSKGGVDADYQGPSSTRVRSLVKNIKNIDSSQKVCYTVFSGVIDEPKWLDQSFFIQKNTYGIYSAYSLYSVDTQYTPYILYNVYTLYGIYSAYSIDSVYSQ